MDNFIIKDDVLTIKLPISTYNIEEINLAYNEMSDRCTVFVDKDDELYSITIRSKEKLDVIYLDFMYQLSEQQTRSILLKHNAKIRDLIVEQAFKPLSSIKEALND